MGIGGGSETTKTEIPGYLKDASQDALARGAAVSDLGYVPYMGPEVAAFQDAQLAAMGNNRSMASSLGLDAGPAFTPPPAQDYGGGVRGYGSYDPFMQAMEQLKAERPGQYDYITSMFIDPVTGQAGPRAMSSVRDARMAPQGMASGTQYGPGTDGRMAGRVMQEQAAGRARSQQPQGKIGGFDMRDFYDGGGIGASGGPHSGGGLLSTVANIGRAIAGKQL